MGKNKGYQKEKQKSWRSNSDEPENSWAGGENKSIEQICQDIDRDVDSEIEYAKWAYNYMAKHTTLKGEELHKWCIENCVGVRFEYKDGYELVPLEKVIEKLEAWRKRWKGRKTYSYQKRTVNKDNQKYVYNSSHSGYQTVRIPSMKRSNAVWKRFYELFPYYREHYEDLNNVNGVKLKKVW